MDSATQTLGEDVATNRICLCSNLFELAENLRIQVDKKDTELAKKEEELEANKQQNRVDFIFFKYNFYVESAPSFCRNCQPSWI
jgi:hypothetical protein